MRYRVEGMSQRVEDLEAGNASQAANLMVHLEYGDGHYAVPRKDRETGRLDTSIFWVYDTHHTLVDHYFVEEITDANRE